MPCDGYPPGFFTIRQNMADLNTHATIEWIRSSQNQPVSL